MHRRAFLGRLAAVAGLGLAAPAVRTSPARAAEVALRLHYLPDAGAALPKAFLQPWASDLAAASGGRLEIQFVTPMQRIAGTLAEAVRSGEFDLAVVPASDPYSAPGALKVFELPFVCAPTAAVNAQAIQAFAEAHRLRLRGLQALAVWGGAQQALHAARPLDAPDSLKGARLRASTRWGGRALEALGAVSVYTADMLVGDAMRRNVLDGCLADWSDIAGFDLPPGAAFHTELPGPPALAVAVSMLAINEARFAAMPADLRQLILSRSGARAAGMAGAAVDAAAGAAREAATSAGQTIVTAGPEAQARLVAATQPVVEAWIAEARGRGLDGTALIGEARALMSKFQPQAPTPPEPAPQLRTAPLRGGQPVEPAGRLTPSPQPAPRRLPSGPLTSPPTPLLRPGTANGQLPGPL